MAEPDDIAIGIDLGTSYSCVSIIENGQTTVIPNEWGERTHASVVSFLEDGTVLVGNSAKRNIITNADNTGDSAKRLIGRFYFSDEVQKGQSVRWPTGSARTSRRRSPSTTWAGAPSTSRSSRSARTSSRSSPRPATPTSAATISTTAS